MHDNNTRFDEWTTLLAGKRILVTGADGFIGSHLTETLHHCGCEVIPYLRSKANANKAKLHFSRLTLSPNDFDTIEWGDISAPDTILRIAELKPAIILHLAADAFVDQSFNSPLQVFRANAIGTQHVLEAARLLPDLERIVVYSSSEVYGTSIDQAMNESHPLNPTSPYGASKLAGDRLAYSYFKTYHMPVVILRPFNCFGPRHVYDVIPKFINAALDGKPLTIYGDGKQARDFTYVSDTVAATVQAAVTSNINGEVFNVGTGQSYSVLDIAHLLQKHVSPDLEIIHLPPRAGEVELLLANSAKARQSLNWQPQVSFEQGLLKNIKWEQARKTEFR